MLHNQILDSIFISQVNILNFSFNKMDAKYYVEWEINWINGFTIYFTLPIIIYWVVYMP